MNKKGKLFVVSAASGSGKTTLCRKLILVLGRKGKRRLVRSISATTRRPRKGEREGRDYYFISRQEFCKRKTVRQFLEWAQVLGNYYGTPREFIEQQIAQGNDILLSIDVQGARQIRGKIKNAVFIFILAPSYRELERRLSRRSTESKADIARRLNLARKERQCIKEYDYVVLNDRLNQALAKLKEIVILERKK